MRIQSISTQTRRTSTSRCRRKSSSAHVVEKIAAPVQRTYVHAGARQFLAQPVHIHFDRVLAHFLVVVIELVDELLLADDAPEAMQQHFEHSGFESRQG